MSPRRPREGGPDPALLENSGHLDVYGREADGARVDGGAKGSPATAGQPFDRLCTLLRPRARHPAKPLRAAAAGARARPFANARPVHRPDDTPLFGTLAVLVPCRFCWRWQHLKGHGAPGAGCPALIMATCRRPP